MFSMELLMTLRMMMQMNIAMTIMTITSKWKTIIYILSPNLTIMISKEFEIILLSY